MSLITRKLEDIIKEAAKKFPVISITGPRQSGKTTLVKKVFKGYTYINFEDPEIRQFATEDPKGFMAQYKGQVVIDEAQYVPNIFSYIQLAVDNNPQKGQYILTGSQNFLLLEYISQSLAGRVAIFNLLPFSIEELKTTKHFKDNYEYYMYNGFYPRIYNDKLEAGEWLKNYIQTYVERDVRKIINVGDLVKFQQFLKLCAGRTGQLVNFSEIGGELGLTYHTVQTWLSILEASFIVFRLAPYYKNFNKRVIKSPKLYFYDTGLAAYLLGIKKPEDILFHFAKGALFENMIITELLKYRINGGLNSELWFWRDSAGNEVDCILEDGQDIKAIEIKSGKTIATDFFKGLDFMQNLSKDIQSYIIYGGDIMQSRSTSKVLSWKNIPDLF